MQQNTKIFKKKVSKNEFINDCIDEILLEMQRTKTERYSIQIDGGIAYYPSSVMEVLNLKKDLPKNPSEVSIRFFVGKSKHSVTKKYEFIKEKDEFESNNKNNFQGFGSIETTMIGKSLGDIIIENSEKQELKWENKLLKEKLEKAEKEIKEYEQLDDKHKSMLGKFEDKIDDLERKNQSLTSTNYMQLAQVGVPILSGLGLLKPEVMQALTGQGLSGVSNSDMELIEQSKWIDETFESVKDDFSELLHILAENTALVPQILQMLKAKNQQ